MSPEAEQKQITPQELAKARLDKNDRTGVLLKQMPEELKKQVGNELNSNPKAKDFYEQMKSVAGGFWDGWEKGVNGALHGTATVFDKTGTWIGEATAEAVSGKDGGLTDKLVEDTQWIRDGLDTTGKVLGETVAKTVSTGEGSEVMNTTTAYWKEQVKKVLAMTPEEQARLAGSGASFLATVAVGAKGLDKLGKIGNMSREVSLGSSIVSRMADKSISETGKLGMEAIGGGRKSEVPNAPHNPTSSELKKMKPNPSSVEANAGLNDVERIAKAEEVLGKRLTPEQKQAVIDAHNVGDNGVYNYTPEELRKKAQLLADSGLNETERRKLIQEGIAGKPKEKPVVAEKKDIPPDTTAVPKYIDKTPQEIHVVLKGEIEKITEYGENNLEKILENSNPANSIEFERLNSRGNAWVRARLGNIANIVEYIETSGKIGLSETDLVSTKNYLKHKISDEALTPLADMLSALKEAGKIKVAKLNIRKLENLRERIRNIPDIEVK